MGVCQKLCATSEGLGGEGGSVSEVVCDTGRVRR